MLAERLLSRVMRQANGRYLSLQPVPKPTLPAPKPGGQYMLYAHVPFCERLCPYCSFNRFPFEESRARAYFISLRDEMHMVANLGYNFGSLYVGGGTPTILVDELCTTIDLARELFDIKEVSSETNPNHLIPEIIDPLVDRVQRFSVGVQSFDDSLLREMERYDKYGSGDEIVERLRSIEGRFHSMNVDMIFNFPSQTSEMLARDVELLKASGANQTTFYPLMASPVVAKSLARTVGRVDYSREARYYAQLSEGLAGSGAFEHASAWTFSRTAGGMIDEYIVDYDDYVGIGSGAFSYVDGTLFVNTFSLREYEAAITAGRFALSGQRVFDRHARMRYRFMMGLFGLKLDKKAWIATFDTSVERSLPVEVAYMRAVGAFSRDDAEAFELTAKGRYLLVAMMREFFVGVNNVRDQARAALPGDERALLFGEGEATCGLAAAVAEVEGVTDTMPPKAR